MISEITFKDFGFSLFILVGLQCVWLVFGTLELRLLRYGLLGLIVGYHEINSGVVLVIFDDHGLDVLKHLFGAQKERHAFIDRQLRVAPVILLTDGVMQLRRSDLLSTECAFGYDLTAFGGLTTGLSLADDPVGSFNSLFKLWRQ
jgi:hypothetical protein